MIRIYDEKIDKDVEFFVGYEVEKSLNYKLKTLFCCSINESKINNFIEIYNIEHVYLGANKSISTIDEFHNFNQFGIKLLSKGVKITIDLDHILANKISEQNFNENINYMISITLKTRKENFTYKIDCKGFFEDIDNVIVVNETDRSLKTYFKEYKQDKILE